jgi:hypothetical protein
MTNKYSNGLVEMTVKLEGEQRDGTKIFMVLHGLENPDPRNAGTIQFLTAEEIGQYSGGN